MARTTRWLALCALAVIVSGFLGLLALDLAWRLGGSSTAESARGEETGARERLGETLGQLVSGGNRESRERQWQTARWLRGRCEAMGYEARIEEYERSGESWPNVVASRAPLSTRAERVVAMAHLDSVSDDPQDRAPGADDNGSGVAVLLEAARALREVETDRPVIFCFFSNEEADRSGSQAFVDEARRQGLRIRAAINVDVVGYRHPARLVDWSAVEAHASWRGRGRAAWTQVRDGVAALRGQRGQLLVAGRLRDRWLVDRVGDTLERRSGLSAVRAARDDCG